MIDHNLEAEIFNIRSFKILTETLKKKHIKNYPIHIKLDTGMRRLGFTETEIDDLIDILNAVDVRTDGNRVSVDFKLTKKDLQKLLDKKKKLRKKMSVV
jgi:hypothetical protein